MFSFASLGHALATAAQKIVSDSKLIGIAVQKAQASEPVVESLTAMVSPQAALIERAAFGLLGKAAQAIIDGGSAVSQGGLNVSLDSREILELKDIAATLRAHPLVQGASVATPGTAPAPPAQ